MKSKSVSGVSRHPRELTFAWSRGDEALIRFWSALLLATAILVGTWFSVRVVVPASMAPDRARVDRAQLIVVGEGSHPSLRKLLSDKSLPSLGVDNEIVDAPMLEGMLSLLGLEEEVEKRFELYPTPSIEPKLTWPTEEQGAFKLPALPAIGEDSWPQLEVSTELQWEVTLRGQGEMSEILSERVLPWNGPVPAIRSAVWSVVLERDGSLAFAGAVDGAEGEIEKTIRKMLQGLFDRGFELEGGASGVVELKFEQKAE
ncbi:MAG: hypothetical protein ACSHYB_18965 [Roseibacillus sp.]